MTSSKSIPGGVERGRVESLTEAEKDDILACEITTSQAMAGKGGGEELQRGWDCDGTVNGGLVSVMRVTLGGKLQDSIRWRIKDDAGGDGMSGTNHAHLGSCNMRLHHDGLLMSAK